jgi:NADPH:quinone reductase
MHGMNGGETVFEGRSWKARAFGEPAKVLRAEETTWPAPPEGLVLVRVRACGTGLPDLLMTRGDYPPIPEPPVAPGQEVAGEVVAVPSGSRFLTGERVMGSTAFADGWGGYADYTYVREARTQRVPDSMSDEEAAGFMIAFRTAYAGLAQRVIVSPGDVLLVLGAAGNTGAAAVQLGKVLGATVIAAAGSAEKLALCRALGADHLIDYRQSDVADEALKVTDGRGADVIFDPVGGDLGTRAAAGLARLGTIAMVGYASGSFLTPNQLDMVLRSYTIAGVYAAGTPQEDREAYGRLAELADRGAIRTPVTTVASFAEVPAVIAGIPTAAPGKTVVRIS